MTPIAENLYKLLPAVYRARDLDQGQPLRALLGVLETELQILQDDVDGLYANWFVETCDPWVVAYLGDLVGADLPGSALPGTDSGRAHVANTLGYRRRKGTASALAAIAQDLSGWPAIGAELFRLVSTTQSINHQRPQNLRTPSLREMDVLRHIGSPFDTVDRTVDLRSVGRSSLSAVAVFVYRLRAYPLSNVSATPAGPAGAYRFDVLGRDEPLFNPLRTVPNGAPATEATLPAPLSAAAVSEALEALRAAIAAGAPRPPTRYFDRQPSFQIVVTRPELLGDPHLAQAVLNASGTGDPNPASIATAVSPGSGLVVHTGTVLNTSGNYGGMWHHIPSGQMAAGHVYSISYSLQVPAGTATLRVSVQDGAGHENALSHNVTAGPGWTRYTFTAVLDTPETAVYVWGPPNVTFDIDELTLEEVAPGTPLGLTSVTPPPAVTAPAPAAVPPEQIVIADLSAWQAPPASKTYGTATLPITAAVDPTLGRLMFAPGVAVSTNVSVGYCYGFSKELGGGPYDRSETFVSSEAPTSSSGGGTLTVVPASQSTAFEIADSLTYVPTTLSVPAGYTVELRAANKQRPLLQPPGTWSITLGAGATLTLNGLLIDGRLSVTASGGATLNLVHCTVVPGFSLSSGDPLALDLTSCITGAIALTSAASTFSAVESIIDGGGAQALTAGTAAAVAPAVAIDRCTILGATTLGSLVSAADTLFCGGLSVAQIATGSVATSFVPSGSFAPSVLAANLCQPALALSTAADTASTLARVQPSFTSTTYGAPGYAQLRRTCAWPPHTTPPQAPVPSQAPAPEILQGGSSRSEMGAFHDLYNPQRAQNLAAGLADYLRYGLAAPLFFVT
jgi:hypothetical protein